MLNKVIKNYLKQLIILGVIFFAMGVGLGLWVFYDTKSTYIYIPFTFIGGSFAYYITTFIAKGGNVNVYLTPHTLTEEEKILNKLIIDYRNTVLMTVTSLALLSIEVVLEIFRLGNTLREIKFDYLVGTFFMSILSVGMACEGAKYISAWWNIRKNMRGVK